MSEHESKVADSIQKYYFNNRVVFLWGEINTDSAGGVIEQMLYHIGQDEKKPIYMVIFSEGGEVDACFSIIDQMKAAQQLGMRVYTINIGSAYSAAAIILAMGTKNCRLSYQNSLVMLHPCSFSLPQDYNENQAKAVSFIQKNVDAVNQMLAEGCGLSGKKYENFMKEIDKGLWLRAEEAQKYGIIDSIINEPISNFLKEREVQNGKKPKISSCVKRRVRTSNKRRK